MCWEGLRPTLGDTGAHEGAVGIPAWRQLIDGVRLQPGHKDAAWVLLLPLLLLTQCRSLAPVGCEVTAVLLADCPSRVPDPPYPASVLARKYDAPWRNNINTLPSPHRVSIFIYPD